MIVVPYSDAMPDAVIDAINPRDGDLVAPRYVGFSDIAYWQLLEQLWRAGDDFAVVEQDIIVNPDTIRGLADCPHRVCAAGYPYLRAQDYLGLGCIRFRTDIMVKHPDLWDRVATHSDVKHPSKHWCSLDAFMQREIRPHWPPHRHPEVAHLHEIPTHGCVEARHLP